MWVEVWHIFFNLEHFCNQKRLLVELSIELIALKALHSLFFDSSFSHSPAPLYPYLFSNFSNAQAFSCPKRTHGASPKFYIFVCTSVPSQRSSPALACSHSWKCTSSHTPATDSIFIHTQVPRSKRACNSPEIYRTTYIFALRASLQKVLSTNQTARSQE